mgnify:CR=1 FL=1
MERERESMEGRKSEERLGSGRFDGRGGIEKRKRGRERENEIENVGVGVR